MSEEMARYEGTGQVVNIEDFAMSIQSLTRQVDLIQEVMKKVMREGEHYGKIPGTNKPTLLKPGAEKLNVTFRLGPSYTIIEKIRDDDFIAYTVRCDLTHIPTGTLVASGIGSCNSKETKYRYRTENTGREVPAAYWNDRDPRLLGGHQFSPRKKDGKWWIMQQVENENPWDLDNTLVKMACKRAMVAAVLNGTAASDIFTQDVEDMPENLINGDAPPTSSRQAGPQSSGGIKEPGSKSGGGEPVKMSEAQQRKIFAQLKQLGVTEDERHGYCGLVLEKTIESLSDLTVQEASKLIEGLAKRVEAQKAA